MKVGTLQGWNVETRQLLVEKTSDGSSLDLTDLNEEEIPIRIVEKAVAEVTEVTGRYVLYGITAREYRQQRQLLELPLALLLLEAEQQLTLPAGLSAAGSFKPGFPAGILVKSPGAVRVAQALRATEPDVQRVMLGAQDAQLAHAGGIAAVPVDTLLETVLSLDAPARPGGAEFVNRHRYSELTSLKVDRNLLWAGLLALAGGLTVFVQAPANRAVRLTALELAQLLPAPDVAILQTLAGLASFTGREPPLSYRPHFLSGELVKHFILGHQGYPGELSESYGSLVALSWAKYREVREQLTSSLLVGRELSGWQGPVACGVVVHGERAPDNWREEFHVCVELSGEPAEQRELERAKQQLARAREFFCARNFLTTARLPAEAIIAKIDKTLAPIIKKERGQERLRLLRVNRTLADLAGKQQIETWDDVGHRLRNS